MIISRIFDPPTYFDPLTLEEYLTISLMMIGALLFFKLIQYFTSGVSSKNALEFSDGNRIVTPFLIDEQVSGEVIVNNKTYSIWVRVVAIILLLFFTVTPLWKVMRELTPFYFTGW